MAYKSRTCHNLVLQNPIYTLWGGKWEEKGRKNLKVEDPPTPIEILAKHALSRGHPPKSVDGT
jgi:hypothetical protein